MPLFVSNLLLTAAPAIQGTGDAGIYRDGDWTVGRPCSAPVLEYPFKGEGDNATFRLRQRFQMDCRFFKPAPIGLLHPTYKNAFLTGEGAHQDKGQYIIEWERQYATIPLTRRVPQSFVYPFQLYQLVRGSPGKLIEEPVSVNSYILREYFRRANIADFPLLQRPRIISAGDVTYKRGYGDLRIAPGTTLIVSNDAEILAEDDSYENWDGDIMCLRRRLIAGPTVAFWGSTFTF